MQYTAEHHVDVGRKEENKKLTETRTLFLTCKVVDIIVPARLETVTDFCGLPFETILVEVTYCDFVALLPTVRWYSRVRGPVISGFGSFFGPPF